MKNTLLAILLLFLAQTGAWFQQFAQVRWVWFKEHPWFNAIVLGVPLSFLFIYGARYAYDVMGSAWSARLIQYTIGIVVMYILSSLLLGEGLTPKNIISLVLSFCIVLIQILWK
jgi:drug/metabolite transporter (DMT)-like permease